MNFGKVTLLTAAGLFLDMGLSQLLALDGPFRAPVPSNLEETIEYDETDNVFLLGTKLGDTYLEVPSLMTSDEYYKFTRKRSMNDYFRDRYSKSLQETQKDKFDFTNMTFDLGPAEKIFGPGGVQIQTSGSASIKLGYNHTRIDNPSLSLQNRKTGSFDFDEQINLNINGKVGDKINMNLNYNTEATFDFDAKKIKLHYQGKEDEIIRLVDAGNITFPSNSSLIQGSNSLFGIRTDLQFGRLSLQMVLSQKESKSSQVSSSGGRQVTDFELDASNYDENRHFFLAHFFRDHFDESMSKLPAILSGIQITRIELWVTNKKSSYDNPRNIVAFTDLGETDHIWNRSWSITGGPAPANHANSMYAALLGTYSGARDIDRLQTVLEGTFTGGSDYEKISNARKLNDNEYILNRDLGYVSLRTALTGDEVLAVAFEYTWNGNSYQVGEFASDNTDNGQALFVKLLKSNSNSPDSGTWDLMMKNIYSITQGKLTKDQFKLTVSYASDNTGSRLEYLPEAEFKSTPLIRLLGMDRLGENKSTRPNGQFDYFEGYTVLEEYGKVIFPVVEPFGQWLETAIGNPDIASKYIFQELYDSTRTVARRIAEKDKFFISGQYSGSDPGIIQLGAYNIPRGSVSVTAAGVTLLENVDYTVDYSMGTVSIINQSILDAGTAVNVQLESNTDYSIQRKTMAGLNWQYEFGHELKMGGTLMHLNEKPLTSKVTMGDEPLVNSMYGLNIDWRHQSQGLTKLIDKLPFVTATQPSNISFQAEMAALRSKVSDHVQGSSSYIDDFESAENGISIKQPSAWSLSAVPSGTDGYGMTGMVESGYHRALLNWFSIDPIFTSRSSSLTPSHIKNDLDQLSNHYVREIYERELYPNKESSSSESTTLQVLNLAYYPQERGPYNLNPDIDSQGFLTDPERSWGGIMRSLSTTDFEAANIEYLEFWMLDPFIYNTDASGGDLYINLGEVSEDVLSDGKKFYENGLPANGDSTLWQPTVWGKVPSDRSLVYAFDNTDASARRHQDVGLNGLSSEEEREWPAYASYLDNIRGKLSPEVFRTFLDDPAADTYHHYRGTDYDDRRTSVLDRYRGYNGTEGNSPNQENSGSRYDMSARTTPDVEDANRDFTLDEYERYFQYRISLRPQDMTVGSNYIADTREVRIKLRNGNTETVNWYCFRIPVQEYEKAVGQIHDFSSIRFMRMYLTGFRESVNLRFATLELITSQWRNYEQPIGSASNHTPGISGTFNATSVNIEENGDRVPVNYVIPPGISRILDPQQSQLVQDNEQAMSLKVTGLGAGEARGIYKKSCLDLRKYGRLQMFTHAEAPYPDNGNLTDGDLSVFIRLGSDYSSNYYEYEIPLELTPPGTYNGNSDSDRRKVWPVSNMLDISMDALTQVKNNRNRQRNLGAITSSQIYSEYDPDHPENRISIAGNPSIGNVRAIMIGIRNNSLGTKSAIVWINELRLIGFESKGGAAAKGQLNLKLSDIANFDMSGSIRTAGFGGLEQSISQRSLSDQYQINMSTSFNLGRFVPDKAKISVPVYYSYSQQTTAPKYSPYDSDLLLDDVLETYSQGHERDSVRDISQTVSEQRNLSISGARINIKSKTPMPYDPANFSVSYSRRTTDNSSSTIEYDYGLNWNAQLNYSYSNGFKGWKPFGDSEIKSKWFAVIKETTFNPLPQNIQFSTALQRDYHETKQRDLEGSGNGNGVPATFSQQFRWQRDLSITWNPTRLLKSSFTAKTGAEVEEPYMIVNKDLYPDLYELWKDSVKTSLRSMGRPLDYRQSFNLAYSAPFDRIPLLNWATAEVSYNSSYSWDRGASYTDGSSYGNIIASRRTVNGSGRINMVRLYEKIPYLGRINNRYKTASKPSSNNVKNAKAFKQEMTLLPDSIYYIAHNLGSKATILTATDKDGHPVKLRAKKINNDTTMIRVRDSLSVMLKIYQDPDRPVKTNVNGLHETFDKGLRVLMMLRSVQFSYTNSYALSVPGFMPESHRFGQTSVNGLMSPGLDFAFGLTDNSFLKRANCRNWLMTDGTVAHTASSSANKDLQLKMTVEPWHDIRIDVNSSWSKSMSERIQYMYDGTPANRSGSFSMTTVSIWSAFEGHKAGNGYNSRSFERMVASLETFRERLERQYQKATYPGGRLAGRPYDPANGAVDPYSSDVMVPAFLAAYSGHDAGKASLDLFPSVLAMLPNWSFTYTGLSNIPAIRKYFKNFSLKHAYKSVYSIGSFNTFNSYMEYMNGRGFIEDAAGGLPVPSSMYNIGSVSINESFAPLAGLDVTLNNGISARLLYNKTRILTLSTSAVQIVESTSDDITFGTGFRIDQVKLFGAREGIGKNKVSNDVNVSFDLSYRNQNALCRNIRTTQTQATSGNRAVKASFQADYTYSRMLTLNFYYDYQSNFPLVATSSYPVSTHDCGFTLKFTLAR